MIGNGDHTPKCFPPLKLLAVIPSSIRNHTIAILNTNLWTIYDGAIIIITLLMLSLHTTYSFLFSSYGLASCTETLSCWETHLAYPTVLHGDILHSADDFVSVSYWMYIEYRPRRAVK